jgi:hypothetical protein
MQNTIVRAASVLFLIILHRCTRSEHSRYPQTNHLGRTEDAKLVFDSRHGLFNKAKIEDLAWRDFFGNP